MKKKISRRNFIKNSATAAAGIYLFPLQVLANPSFDLLIKGATILDGTGSAEWKADLGIRGDSIAALGQLGTEQGKNVIDASGLYASPGFVDIHSHSDFRLSSYPMGESRVMQGITTEITGNCGSSVAPFAGLNVEERKREYAESEGVTVDWSDVASYFKKLQNTKFSLNQALLVGQGTLRENAIGLVDRSLTADELRSVLFALEQALDQGAIGMSTGLEYTPGRYTPMDEIVEMARVVARKGGLYASHIRNEVTLVLEAVEEAIQIGRRAGVRVEISHLKTCGRSNWPKQRATLELIESGRAKGVDVLADAYPYPAYSTGLTVLFQNWALEGGTEAILKRLRNPKDRARIRSEVLDYVAVEPGGFDLIVISGVKTEKNRKFVGKNMVEISEIRKTEPVDSVLDLIEQEDTSVSYIGHAMSDDNVGMVLSHPLVMLGSDGSAQAPVGRAALEKPHPRNYGAYPRFLTHYVRDQRLIDLPVAIKKATSMPAAQAGIQDRGLIAKGKKADIVLFNLEKLTDLATFEDPHRYPKGIQHVIVNGVPVVTDGKHTGARPGSIIT